MQLNAFSDLGAEFHSIDDGWGFATSRRKEAYDTFQTPYGYWEEFPKNKREMKRGIEKGKDRGLRKGRQSCF